VLALTLGGLQNLSEMGALHVFFTKQLSNSLEKTMRKLQARKQNITSNKLRHPH